jgi:hypothetical protein
MISIDLLVVYPLHASSMASRSPQTHRACGSVVNAACRLLGPAPVCGRDQQHCCRICLYELSAALQVIAIGYVADLPRNLRDTAELAVIPPEVEHRVACYHEGVQVQFEEVHHAAVAPPNCSQANKHTPLTAAIRRWSWPASECLALLVQALTP